MTSSLSFIKLIVILALRIFLVGLIVPHAQAQQKSPPARASAIRFQDITRAAGIDFHLTCGSAEKRYIMEAMCGGAAFFDYDNDGWLDLLLVNGSSIEDMTAGKCHSSKLYRNNHDGTFSDVTAKAHLAHCRWGFGVAVGDYDNDGWEDVYITDLDGGVLYHNDHGVFREVTAQARASNDGSWGTSAAFGDYDRDGYLDLYVTNYVDIDLKHLPVFGSGPNCQYRGIPVSCGPRGLKGSRDRLYRNNGDGTFTDVTEKLGIDAEAEYGLGVIWLDFDRDGCLDLYIANDSSPSLLYHNDCHGGFQEVGVMAGVAFSADGRPQAGMGVDAADFDGDGLPEIVKTNFSDDTNNLYHNDGQGQFTDIAGPTEFGLVSIPFLGFGVKFFDFDNDGWKDVVIANGHVNPQVDQHSFGVSYRQRPLLFRNVNGKSLEEVGKLAGPSMVVPRVGRGLAVADINNDGTPVLLMTQVDGSPVLLRPVAPPKSQSKSWLRVKLQGSKSNRDAFGATVELRAGNHVWWDEVRSNSSYLSASDPRLHFGLGSTSVVDSISVHWPSGLVEQAERISANQEVVFVEGRGLVSSKRSTSHANLESPSKRSRD